MYSCLSHSCCGGARLSHAFNICALDWLLVVTGNSSTGSFLSLFTPHSNKFKKKYEKSATHFVGSPKSSPKVRKKFGFRVCVFCLTMFELFCVFF